MTNSNEPTSRCCINCKHCGYFFGVDGLSCEITAKPRKAPRNYTNCKSFGFDDPVGIRTIAYGKGLVVSA